MSYRFCNYISPNDQTGTRLCVERGYKLNGTDQSELSCCGMLVNVTNGRDAGICKPITPSGDSCAWKYTLERPAEGTDYCCNIEITHRATGDPSSVQVV